MKVFLCLLAALCASVIVDAQPNGGTVSTQYDAPLRTGQPITLSPVAGSAELRGSVTDGIVGCETVRHAFTVTAPAVNPVGTRGEGCRTSTCTNSPIVLSVAIGKAQASFSSFAPGPENFPDLNVQIVKDSGASFVGQSFSAAQGAQSFTENRNANPPQATFSSGNTVATCGAILPSQCVVDLWCTLFSTGSYFAYVSNSGPYSGVNAVGNIPNLYNITVSQWNFNVQTIPASRTINQAALNSSAVGSVPAPGNFLTQYFHNLVTTPGDRAAHSKLRITFSATPNSLGVITPFSTPQTINVCFSFFQLPGVGPAQTPDNSCPGQSCGTITLNANSTVATFVFSTASTSCSLWTDYTISTHCLWFGITGTALTGTNFNVTIDFVPNKSPPVTTVLASSLVDRSDKIGKTYRNESALVDINSNQCVFNPTSDTVSPLFTCERSYQVSLQSEGLSASSYDGVLGPNLLVRVRAVTDGNLYYSVTDNTLNGPRTSCYSNPSQAGLLGAGTQPAPNTPSFWSSGLTDISITPPPQEVLGVGTPYAPSIPALTQDDAGTVLAGQPSQEVEISPQRSNSGKIVIPACRWRTTYQNYGCPSGQICTCAAGTSYDNNWVITVVAGNQFTQGSNSVSNLIRYAIDVDTVSWPVTAVVVDNNTPPIFGNVGELNYQHYYVDITTSNLFDDSYFEANLYSNHEQDELWFYWNFGSYAGDVNDCYKNSGRCQTRGDSGLGIAGQSPNPGTDFFEGSCCRFLFLPCTAAADWIGPNNGYNGPGSATLSGYRNGGNPTNNILESGRKLSTLQVGRYYFAVQGVSQTLTSGYNTAPSRDSTGDINTQLYNFDRSIDYTLVFNLRRTEVIYDQVPVVHHVFFQDLTHQYQIQVPNLPNVLATVINIDDVRNGAVTLFVQCGSYAGACQSSTTFNCYSNLASTDIGNANSFAGHKGSLVVPRCKCSNNLVYASVWGRVQNGTTNYYQSNLPIKFILTAVIVNTPNTVQQIAASRAGETVKYFSPGSKANSDPTNSALAGYYFYQLSFTNVDLTGNDALVLELVVEEDGTAPDDNVILYVSKNQLAGAVSASGYFCNPQLSCTAAPSLDQNNPLALQQHCSIVIQPCAAGVNPNCPATGVAPFDGIHNTWYVSVFHQQNFGAAEDVHFTVSAQVVAQQAQTLTNGVWLKGDLLNGQYRHYKFSLAGTTIKPTDKLLTELYNCPDSRVQATLYFTYTNSTTVPSLAGLASDCLNSICGTCTVGGPATNPNYCHIQVNPCTLSTQTGVYYMSVLTTQPQFGDYHCAYSIRTSIISSEELITSTPASLAGYGYPLTGNLYGGLSGATANYYTVTLPTPLTGANSAGKTLEIEVENVRGGKVFVSISSNRNPAQLCDGANTGREVDDPFLTAAGVTPGGPTANLNAVANQLHWTRFTCNLAAGQVYYIVVDAIQTLRLWDPVSYNIRAILNDVGFTALNFGTPATNTTNNVLVAKQYDNCPIPTLAAPPASPCTTGNTAIYGTPQGSIDSVTSQLYYAYSIPASTVGNADGTSLDIFVSQTNPTGGVLYDVFVSANFPGSNAATNDGVTTDGTLAVPTCPSLCTFSSIDFNTGKAFCHIRPCDLLSSGTYYITLYGRGLAPGATISGLVIRSYVVNSKSILAVPSGSVKLSSTTTSVCAVNTADCVITPNVGIFQNTNDQLESYIQGSQATGNPPAVSVTNAYYQTNSTLGLNAGEAVDFIYQGTATSFSVRYGGEIGGGSCVPTCSVNTGSPLICRIYNCGPGALSPSTWFVQLVGPSTGVAGANFIIHKYSSPAGTTNAISVAQGLPTDPAYNGTQYPFTSNSGPYDWIWYSVSLNKPTADQDLAYDLVFNPSTNLFAGLGGNGGIFALPAGVTTPVVLPDLQTRTFPSGNQVAINGDSSVRGSFGCGAIGFAAPAGKCCFQNVNYFFAFVNPNTFNSTAASTPFGIEWLVQDRGSVASTLALNTVNSALTISDTPNLSDGRTRIHWQSFTLPPQTSFWINALVNPVSGSTNANVFDMTLYMGTDYKSGSGTTLGTCGNFTYTSASNSDFTGGLRTNATATYPNGIVVGSTFGNPGACRYNAGSDPTNTASAQGPLAGATSLTPGGTNYTAFYPFCGCLNNQKSITIYIGITYRGTTTDPVVTLTYSLNVFLFPLATPAINTAVTNVVYPNSNTAVRSISGAVVYHHYAVAINPTTLSLINPTGVLANFIPDAPIITAGPITIDTNRMYAELGINNVRITQSPSTVISYPFTNYYSLSGQLAGSTGDNTCYSNSQWDPTLCNGWVSGSLNTTSGSANVTSSFCRISLASLLNACGQTWYFSVASTTGLLANQTYSYDFSFNLFANTQNEVVITTLTPVAAVQPNTIPPASEAPYTTFTSQNKTIAAGASQNIYTFFKFSTSTFSNGKPFDTTAPVQWARVSVLNQGTATSPSRILNTIRVLAGYTTTPTGLPIVVPTFGSANTGNICTNLPNTDNNVTSLVENLCVIEFDPSQFRMLSGDGGPHTLYVEVQANTPNTVIPDSYAFQIKVEILTATFLDSPINLTPVVAPAWSYDKLKEIYDNQYQFYQFNIPENSCYFYDFTVKFSQEGCGTKNLKLYWSWQDVYATTASQVVKFDTTRPLVVPSPAYSVQGTGVPGIFGTVGPSFVTHSNLDSCTIIGGSYQVAVYALPGTALFQSPINVTTGVFANRKTTYRVQARLQQWAVRKIALECFDSQVLHYTTDINGTALDNLKKFVPRYEVAVDAVNRGTQLWFDLQLSTPVLAGANVRLQVSQNPTPQQQGDDSSSSTSYCGWGTNTAGISGDYANQEFDYACNIVAGGTTCSITIAPCEFRSTTWYAYVSIGALTAGIITEPNLCIGFLNSGVVSSVPTACNSTLADNTVVSVRARYDRKSIPVAQLDQTPYQVVWVGNLVPAYWQYYKVNVNSNDALGLFDAKLAVTPCAGSPCNLRMYVSRGPVGFATRNYGAASANAGFPYDAATPGYASTLSPVCPLTTPDQSSSCTCFGGYGNPNRIPMKIVGGAAIDYDILPKGAWNLNSGMATSQTTNDLTCGPVTSSATFCRIQDQFCFSVQNQYFIGVVNDIAQPPGATNTQCPYTLTVNTRVSASSLFSNVPISGAVGCADYYQIQNRPGVDTFNWPEVVQITVSLTNTGNAVGSSQDLRLMWKEGRIPHSYNWDQLPTVGGTVTSVVPAPNSLSASAPAGCADCAGSTDITIAGLFTGAGAAVYGYDIAKGSSANLYINCPVAAPYVAVQRVCNPNNTEEYNQNNAVSFAGCCNELAPSAMCSRNVNYGLRITVYQLPSNQSVTVPTTNSNTSFPIPGSVGKFVASGAAGTFYVIDYSKSTSGVATYFKGRVPVAPCCQSTCNLASVPSKQVVIPDANPAGATYYFLATGPSFNVYTVTPTALAVSDNTKLIQAETVTTLTAGSFVHYVVNPAAGRTSFTLQFTTFEGRCGSRSLSLYPSQIAPPFDSTCFGSVPQTISFGNCGTASSAAFGCSDAPWYFSVSSASPCDVSYHINVVFAGAIRTSVGTDHNAAFTPVTILKSCGATAPSQSFFVTVTNTSRILSPTIRNIRGGNPVSSANKLAFTVTVQQPGCVAAGSASADDDAPVIADNGVDSNKLSANASPLFGTSNFLAAAQTQNILSCVDPGTYRIDVTNNGNLLADDDWYGYEIQFVNTWVLSGTVSGQQLTGAHRQFYQVAGTAGKSISITVTVHSGPALRLYVHSGCDAGVRGSEAYLQRKICQCGTCKVEISTLAAHSGSNNYYIVLEGANIEGTYASNSYLVRSQNTNYEKATVYDIATTLGSSNCVSVPTTGFCGASNGEFTGSAFAGSLNSNVWKYNSNLADNEAQCRYQTLLVRCPSPTAACRQWLRIFSCLESFPQCDSNGFQLPLCGSVCNKVQAACGAFLQYSGATQGFINAGAQYICSSSRYFVDGSCNTTTNACTGIQSSCPTATPTPIPVPPPPPPSASPSTPIPPWATVTIQLPSEDLSINLAPIEVYVPAQTIELVGSAVSTLPTIALMLLALVFALLL